MTPALFDRIASAIGPKYILAGSDPAARRFSKDWTGAYNWQPWAVARPASTAEVSELLKLANEVSCPVVPVGGQTGLTGALHAEGALMISLDRMKAVRSVDPASRTAIVEAGAVLSDIHDAAAQVGLYFPLWFGARGSAMVGGALSTNAGGSNVVRYGSTRVLCLGLEVVLSDGRVLNLMSQLHKDNSGYDLKDLFIGAEGTLGVITAAVLKLVEKPRVHVTAMLALDQLDNALAVLSRLQGASGGLVEAFEFMPRSYMAQLADLRPDLGQPFDPIEPVTILAELGATSDRDCVPGPDGVVPLTTLVESVLGAMLDDGTLKNAIIAQSEAQRAAFWARREAAAEIAAGLGASIDFDVAVPVDRVETFLSMVENTLRAVDQGAFTNTVAHLGDGNVHLAVYLTDPDPTTTNLLTERIEDVVFDLGGSFSAEHGIGLSKLPSMRRRKDPVALDMMRAVKLAFDPKGILNPGKTVPDMASYPRVPERQA